MKKCLLFTILFALSMTLFSQTNTWNGNADNNWSNVSNWSLNALPTASHDVVVPTGKTVNLNVAGTTKSIVVQGNSTLNMSNNLSILNASSVAVNVTVNWSSGSLIGGGHLTNNGTIHLTTGGSRYISGGTTLTNNGMVTMPAGGYFYLYDTSVFNNAASGIFDIQSNAFVSYSGSTHSFNNAGMLKKTISNGDSQFQAILNNTGTISVESGNLTLNSASKIFNGGVYNVSSGSALVLSVQVAVSNTLTGLLNGALNWASNISVASTATFNFTGTTGVTWTTGSLLGGGTLTNLSNIHLASSGSRYVSGGTTLTNNGMFTMPSGGYFYLYDTSVFNNTASGVFDLQSNAYVSYSGSTHSFNNAGLLKKSGGDGDSQFQAILNNTGTISVQNGSLTMNSASKILNGGVYNVSTGSALVVGVQVSVSNTLTGLLNGALNWASNISVASTATFNFTGPTGVTWTTGSLLGGGTLTNLSSIHLASNGSRYISGGTTLTNNGMFTMPSGGYFYLYDTSVFNNGASGVFDLQSNAYVSYSASTHSFNNAGLLKKSGGDGDSQFQAILNNTGTISVENGSLTLNSLGKIFNGGVYNVSTGNALILTVQVAVNNTLTGVLDGPMNWTNNISVASAATFNFTGTTGVRWTTGSLLGGGVLTNASHMSLSTGGSRYISGVDTQLVNTGTIVFPDGGYLYLYNNAILDNQDTGVIDFQSDAIISYSGGDAFQILNAGLIEKTAGAGVTYIYAPVTNSGIIDASSGEFEFVDGFNLVNTIDGTIKGTATIDVPAAASFTNNGTFAPGGSPGTLSVLGTYKSSTSAVLEVELNGLTAGTQYDVMAVTGTNAVFDGDVNVILGFEPVVGNAFTVATTSSAITTKSLTTPLTSDYLGKRYTFNVTYPGDTAVRLTVASILDIQAPTVVTQNVTLQLNASGNATLTAAQINNGSSDNCSIAANLTYSLSQTAFTCANLGANTVTLTVTDEANNAAALTATVTVEDSINPSLSCPTDITVDSNGNYSLPNYVSGGQATASDNCSVTVVQSPVAGTVLADGMHVISFTATDGSGNSVNCSFNLDVNDTTLGIADATLNESSIVLFPNPVSSVLTIKNSNNLELENAQMTDITGKIISTYNLKDMGLTKEISLEHLSNGMYFIQINALNSAITKRVIKQ